MHCIPEVSFGLAAFLLAMSIMSWDSESCML